MQELVSAEKTPTLSLVLPMYEQLIGMLQDLKFELPKLGHAIEAARGKLDEYMEKTRKTPMHVFAMGTLRVLTCSCSVYTHLTKRIRSIESYH